MFGKKKKRIRELEALCGKAFLVINEMSHELGIHDHPVTKEHLDAFWSSAHQSIVSDPLPSFNLRRIMETMPPTWGYHALFDCHACDKQVITNGSRLEYFMRELVKKIDMKAFGLPIVKHFATHDPAKGGYTVMQMIETSAIVGHFVDANGDAYLDIFSCKPFDLNVTEAFINEFLKPEYISSRFVRRQA